MQNFKKYLLYLLGVFFFVFGIYLSVYQNNAHFYTPFSIGLFIITLTIYNSLSKEPVFNNWKIGEHFIFWILMIFASIIIDEIGLALNFWYYPHYFNLFDQILKITFEYAVALAYFMNILLISKNLINKVINSSNLSFVLSLLFLIPLTLVFTEYINAFSNSWVVNLPKYIWFSIGSWLMALTPFAIYKFVNKK